MGMLSMLLEGIRQQEYKDLQLVPIHLSYEKVVETASYRRELTGGSKKSESVSEVSSATAAPTGGAGPERRAASMDLPEPGAPTNIR